MRWPATREKYPQEGNMRTRVKFAWLPIQCGDEVVWLEKYIVKERFDADEMEESSWTPIRYSTWDAEVRS